MKFLLSILLLSISVLGAQGNETITSFSNAKSILKDKIFSNHPRSVYCNCPYNRVVTERNREWYEEDLAKAKEKYLLYHWDSLEGFEYPDYEEWSKRAPKVELIPDLKACGYVPKGSGVRASRIEWEHIVPASEFGHSFSEWNTGHSDCITPAKDVRKCWRNEDHSISCKTEHQEEKAYKGRRCASKANAEFSRMEADLHNLHPAVGELNGYRSSYPVAEIPGEEREFGACDAEIKDNQFEPAPSVRGDIARTYFYMSNSYPNAMQLSPEMKSMLERWNESDPVDRKECLKHGLVVKEQGNVNPMVAEGCKQLGISDEGLLILEHKGQMFENIYEQ
jgi:deoxyribonuclease-1